MTRRGPPTPHTVVHSPIGHDILWFTHPTLGHDKLRSFTIFLHKTSWEWCTPLWVTAIFLLLQTNFHLITLKDEDCKSPQITYIQHAKFLKKDVKHKNKNSINEGYIQSPLAAHILQIVFFEFFCVVHCIFAWMFVYCTDGRIR